MPLIWPGTGSSPKTGAQSWRLQPPNGEPSGSIFSFAGTQSHRSFVTRYLPLCLSVISRHPRRLILESSILFHLPPRSLFDEASLAVLPPT